MENIDNNPDIAHDDDRAQDHANADGLQPEQQQQQQQPEQQQQQTAGDKQDAPDPDIQRLIDEAEQRGYIRGRNESIDSIISKHFDDGISSDSDSCADPSEPCPSFLAHIRPGFWDN